MMIMMEEDEFDDFLKRCQSIWSHKWDSKRGCWNFYVEGNIRILYLVKEKEWHITGMNYDKIKDFNFDVFMRRWKI